MARYLEKYKKNIAIDMRKRGLSYSEIENRIHIPRSTLSFWLKKIKLSEEQKKKLNLVQREALKRGLAKRILKNQKAVEEIRKSSASNIKKISDKELWLMGITLYWRERLLSGNENDLRKGVKFTSSDPYLIKLFLKWLQNIGRIKDEEIAFDLFINKQQSRPAKEIIEYWSDVTDCGKDKFAKIYWLKSHKKTGNKGGKREVKNKTKYGLLRIRVRASSMLARQINGWVRGIIRYYWT